MPQPTIIRVASSDEFETRAVDCITSAITSAIASTGRCRLGLSGGSTPRPIYAALALDASIDWSKTSAFLVDERYVPASHPDSNQRMLRETIFMSDAARSRAVLPNTSLPISQCIDDYQFQLSELLPPDFVVLGMGEDGHIASLFPPLSPEAFGPKNVIRTTTDHFPVRDRVSVTLPVLKSAKARLFLITGAAKGLLLSAMLSENEDPSLYPAQHLSDERTTWIVL